MIKLEKQQIKVLKEAEELLQNVKKITPAQYLKEYFNIEVKEDMNLEELYKFMDYCEMDSKPLSVAYWDYPMEEWEEILMDHIEDGICTLVQIEDRLFEVPRLDKEEYENESNTI